MDQVMFSRPFQAGLEEQYVREVLTSALWHGDGSFTARATRWLLDRTGAAGALLTTSCTHALEMASILLGIGPGDEVICPSFTFPATATAIAIRGATPVLVDVQADTMNIDPVAVEAAITRSTKAIYVVHYGGVAVDLDAILTLADRHGLAVVEDNAHSIGGYFRGQHLGTFGVLGTQSWHDTKNVSSGEGGALLVNDPSLMRRAEIIREKGTDRARFLRGEIDRYTWVDQGSSYIPSEILAAVLTAQFERFDDIQTRRHRVWNMYEAELPTWASNNGVRLMHVPPERKHPAHLFYVLMPSHQDQAGLIGHLRHRNIVAAFHYQPLDSSTAGQLLGRTPYPCSVTAEQAGRLVRLPLHPGLSQSEMDRILEGVTSYSSHTP